MNKTNMQFWKQSLVCATALCPCPCRVLCVPYNPPKQDEHGTVHCKYDARAFSIGIKHTVFFLKNKSLTVCSSVQNKPLDLSQLCEFTWHPSIVTVTFSVIITEINYVAKYELRHFIMQKYPLFITFSCYFVSGSVITSAVQGAMGFCVYCCVVQWEHAYQWTYPHMMQVMEADGSAGPAPTPLPLPWTKTLRISSATEQ